MKDTTLNLYDYANIFNVYIDENNLSYYNLYNTINIDLDIDHTLYTEYFWSDVDDWYTLSFKSYGTTRLWWILLLANQVMNPFEDIIPGQKIKILNSSTVSTILNQISLNS